MLLEVLLTRPVSAVYITANISGGHLNPAVTVATMVTGHIPPLKGLAYIFVQLCGACFGMLMVVSSFLSKPHAYAFPNQLQRASVCTQLLSCYKSAHNMA